MNKLIQRTGSPPLSWTCMCIYIYKYIYICLLYILYHTYYDTPIISPYLFWLNMDQSTGRSEPGLLFPGERDRPGLHRPPEAPQQCASGDWPSSDATWQQRRSSSNDGGWCGYIWPYHATIIGVYWGYIPTGHNYRRIGVLFQLRGCIWLSIAKKEDLYNLISSGQPPCGFDMFFKCV